MTATNQTHTRTPAELLCWFTLKQAEYLRDEGHPGGIVIIARCLSRELLNSPELFVGMSDERIGIVISNCRHLYIEVDNPKPIGPEATINLLYGIFVSCQAN